MPTMIEALRLARAGWEVLPLHGKVPRTAHGVKDATTDAEQIAAWWSGEATHNIGARVPAEVVVLDFDPQNGGSVGALEEAAEVALPVTLTVHSGRETGGQHRYYLRPAGVLSSARLPVGIDVKTDRGYCVMPPSLHPLTARPYRWELHPHAALPPQVVALLHRKPPQVPRKGAKPARPLAARAQHLVRYVEQLHEGQRNAGLYWAACRAVEDDHPPASFDSLRDAAVSAGLSEFEAARTIDSARRSGGGHRV